MAGKKKFHEQRPQVSARLESEINGLFGVALSRSRLKKNTALVKGVELFVGWAFLDESQKKAIEQLIEDGKARARKIYGVIHEQEEAPNFNIERSPVPKRKRN